MLENPNKELVETYLTKFNNDLRYNSGDKAIIKLFDKFPTNTNIEDIILKISVINDLYSTNIFGTFKLAEHILRIEIDKDLKTNNPNLVHKIATGHGIQLKKNNKEINFYSFATKYCNWHKKDFYPIYDLFVDKIIRQYRKQDNFYKFKNEELKNYKKFIEIIENFKSYYNFSDFGLKEIDKFLWIYGKEKFPTKY